RESLLRLRTHVTTQRHALISQGPVIVDVIVDAVPERLERLEQIYTEQVAAIDAELADVLQPPLAQESGGQETSERLQTIPGVGCITALWMVVATLNFTICASAEQAVAYAGLAPLPRQSGTSVNKRPIFGHAGKLRLRTALSRATVAGARFT